MSKVLLKLINLWGGGGGGSREIEIEIISERAMRPPTPLHPHLTPSSFDLLSSNLKFCC